jgi:hypothetical protein
MRQARLNNPQQARKWDRDKYHRKHPIVKRIPIASPEETDSPAKGRGSEVAAKQSR